MPINANSLKNLVSGSNKRPDAIRVTVWLNPETIELARQLGDGKTTRGLDKMAELWKERLEINQLKIGDLVEALAVRKPKQKSKKVGTVHLLAKAFVYNDVFYIGDQITNFVEFQIDAGEDKDEWDLADILTNRLQPVVMIRLTDGSFYTWWNQSFRLIR